MTQFEKATEKLKEAGKLAKIPPWILEILSMPQRILTVNFPVKMDSGKVRVFEGFRVQHNNALGPYKGGIRFFQNVDLEEVKTLAFLMMVKCSVADLPMGGGKGGVIVDPRQLSEKELERLSRAYVSSIADVIGPYQDVPAPDMNTNGKIMTWMGDEYGKALRSGTALHAVQNRTADSPDLTSGSFRSSQSGTPPRAFILKENEILATFTGKPLGHGGSEGREEATGKGGLYVLLAVLNKLNTSVANKIFRSESNRSLKEKNLSVRSSLRIPQKNLLASSVPLTVAVQGFGNVGYNIAKFLEEAGFKVVAVSDSKGGIMVKEGLDIEKVMECKKKQGTLAGCYCSGGVCDLKMGKVIDQEELLELPVDILVPAALENVINVENARKIKASIILEMANGPVTPEADKILQKRDVVVIPDVLANSGGVTVSYFEWKQNLENAHWTKIEINKKLKEKMEGAVRDLWDLREKYKTDLRTAAYILAVQRIAEKMP